MTFLNICDNALNNIYRPNTPFKTGNLRNKGTTTLSEMGYNVLGFEMGGQNAPYGVLLNESPKLKSKKNKHYMWHDKLVNKMTNYIASQVGGIVINE